MGKTGTVEMAGMMNGPVSADGSSMSPAYYVRIDGLPPVLIDEVWLEEA